VVALEHTEHTLAIPGLSRPISILQLSDVHLRGRDMVLDTILAALKGLQPDLVVLTGDTITRGWKRDVADDFCAALPAAPMGRFAIMGNWEYWGHIDAAGWRWFLNRHGIRLLVDESVALEPFTLAGTDDLLAGRPDVEKTYAGVDFSRPVVTLTHSPGLFPELVRPNVHLVLSGHTHGGQVLVPGLGAPFLPRASGRYPAGWYQQEESHLFVSRGVGWSIAPYRVRCAPELVTIQLVPA
jgi:predicted MPP superfamily phosphohydrolase